MSSDPKAAVHSVRFLNAQLSQLYANAVDCVQSKGTGLLPTEENRALFALAEFYFGSHRAQAPSKNDLHFFASFGKPTLEIICNHEAVLHLKIDHGHYSSDTTASGPAPLNTQQQIRDVSASFHVPFKVHAVPSPDASHLGVGAQVLQVIVFDYEHPVMDVLPSSLNAQTKSALERYLAEYLHFLKETGFSTLATIPDFDDDGQGGAVIDYSPISPTPLGMQLTSNVKIFGIALPDINEYISWQWSEALRRSNLRRGQFDDWLSVSFAEFQSSWTRNDLGSHFHVLFGAPKIRYICPHEVYLTLVVDEVRFYKTGDFTASPVEVFTKWEIALLGTVQEEKDSTGRVIRLRLVFNSTPFFPDLSHHGDFSEAIVMQYWEVLVHFLATEYIEILKKANRTIIYELGDRPSFKPADPEPLIENPIINQHESPTCGFDSIELIPLASINSQFKALWESKIVSNNDMRRWTYEDAFSASFGPLSLKLHSSDKAIVWVDLTDVRFKDLQNGLPSSHWENRKTDKQELPNCRLAFEVRIKLSEHVELARSVSASLEERFHTALVRKSYGGYTLRHLFLDLLNAEFVHELSSFGTLQNVWDRTTYTKVDSVVNYIQKYYFKHIAEQGHHILHSLPIHTGHTNESSDLCLSFATFSVYAKYTYSRHSCMQYDIASHDSPSIAIFGMYRSRTPPALHLKWSSWLTTAVAQAGVDSAVYVARAAFLDHLPEIFAGVSAQTTIVPALSGIEDGQYRLRLTTWAKQKQNASQTCPWKQLTTGKDGELQYEWVHNENWTHEYDNSPHGVTKGTFYGRSGTSNHLRIETNTRGGVEIVLKGLTELEIGHRGTSDSWSSKATAEWESNLGGLLDNDGLQHNTLHDIRPNFKTVHTQGHPSMESRALLEGQLRGSVGVSDILAELTSVFHGVWKYSYPALGLYVASDLSFAAQGDLLVKLRQKSDYTASTAVHHEGFPTSHIIADGSAARSGNSHNGNGVVKSASTNNGLVLSTMVTNGLGRSISVSSDSGHSILSESTERSSPLWALTNPRSRTTSGSVRIGSPKARQRPSVQVLYS